MRRQRAPGGGRGGCCAFEHRTCGHRAFHRAVVRRGNDGRRCREQLYKDGEYTSVGSYVSPGGTEEIGVTLTLEKDVVTAVATEPMPSNPTAKLYQARFSGGIEDQIVGKKLDDLAVDKVAGSSLTSGGFAQAADKIKGEARL
jgi:uncharacterized protein with FMN-binding domain